MATKELNDAMQAKLASLGIPYESLQVFGVVRCNVHVKCSGFDTARKWVSLLSQVFKGAKVTCTETQWPAVANKGTCLKPTLRKGYLVGVAA